jgi:DNA-binding NarL/FixJ family response regulator
MTGRHLSTSRSASSSPAQSHAAIPYAQDDSQELSKRELQIVELIAAGLTNQEISLELEISKRTVDNHVSNILNKTATGNRVALVRWALQSGKVCLDELNCCHLPQ